MKGMGDGLTVENDDDEEDDEVLADGERESYENTRVTILVAVGLYRNKFTYAAQHRILR